MGYSMSNGMGQVPLSFTEIYSYMKSMKLDLLPSEVLLLRNMSQAYVSQSYDKNPLSQPPYIDKEMIIKRDNSEEIKNKFLSLV